jgi:signal transduction histidine kinase
VVALTATSARGPTTGRGWWGWTLARRLRAVLVALSLLLLVAGLALVAALGQVDRALSNQTQRTFPARVAASQLLTSLVDQETGLRGFALTRDPGFLEPYRKGVIDEQKARARLEEFVAPGDPARLTLLTVDAAIEAWREQYAALRITAAGDPESDTTIRFGQELFERVRQTTAELDTRLSREVSLAQERADRDRRIAITVLGLMALAVVLAVLGLQRALKTAVLEPLTRLGAQVAVVSRGDHRSPIVPVGPPDIREMGEGVESMRVELVGVLAEVEEQRLDLERRARDLARSNADLEQFAYVASHDLQEPLRKVASFCQLLEQRYGDQLDDRGHQYIAFAVDGAKRMQLLISDLLTFSRVGRTSEGFVSVELADIVQKAWSGLEARRRDTGGKLDFDAGQRHTVVGDPSLLQLLFANILGNALKYRRPDTQPQVRLGAKPGGSMLRVCIDDNGIGIPAEYAEKVFVIFQRLHGRDEYEGTGIGLALAKKVVEFHGGTIAALASPLGGTRIEFTLPLPENPAHV